MAPRTNIITFAIIAAILAISALFFRRTTPAAS